MKFYIRKIDFETNPIYLCKYNETPYDVTLKFENLFSDFSGTYRSIIARSLLSTVNHSYGSLNMNSVKIKQNNGDIDYDWGYFDGSTYCLPIRSKTSARPLCKCRSVDWNSGTGTQNWESSDYNTFKYHIVNTIYNSYLNYNLNVENVNVLILYNQKVYGVPLGHDYKHHFVFFYDGNDPNYDEFIEV